MLVDERKKLLPYFCLYVLAVWRVEPCNVHLTVSTWLRCFLMRSGEVIWTVFTSFEIEGYFDLQTALPKVSFFSFQSRAVYSLKADNPSTSMQVRQNKTGSIQRAHIFQHQQIIPRLHMARNFRYLSQRVKQRATQ